MKILKSLMTGYCIALTVLSSLAQGVQGGADLGQSNIVFYENFSSATIANSASATNTQWTYTNTSGAITPTIATSISGSITMGSNEGYDDVTTKKALRIPFTALSNDITVWTPTLTVPNSSNAWARLILYSESLLGLTNITLGSSFDSSPCDFSLAAETGAGYGPFSLSYAVATYGEGSNITNSSYNYRIVYVDISRFANRTGRLGFRITNPNASGSTAVMVIDGVSIGKRPTNDACSGAYQLVNGVNGPFYNTLATGLLPRCNTPSSTNLGGSTLYLNPTSATTRPGDGYEPSTGNGIFSSTSNTVENSTWYKFTTPTLTTMTECNGGTPPTSMQVKITVQNLSCEAPANVISVVSPAEDQQQIRVFRSAFSCSSTNAASTEQLTAYTTLGSGNSITLSTASGLAYNSTYYLVIDANYGNNCRFDLKTETFLNGGASPLSPPCTILPVELLDFSAEPLDENNVQIHWVTATEHNNDYFTVERSGDGEHYEEIHKVSGAGNSTEQLNYGFVDVRPIVGMNYYRLTQTDYDGRKTVYDPDAVWMGSGSLLKVIPNPGTGEFHIFSEDGFRGDILVQVTDPAGRTHFQEEKRLMTKESSLFLDLSRLDVGMYHVQVVSDGVVHLQKLIISR